MKKTIHVAFVGMVGSFFEKNYFYKILQKNYDLVVHDDPNEADYIICSIFCEPYEYCKFPGVRIMYSGENYIPDFNLVDYGVSSYPLTLGDRHFSWPMCIDEYNHFVRLKDVSRKVSLEDLKEKIYFANLVSGHESEYSMRGKIFDKLSEYKRVESAGTYLNNMQNGECVNWGNGTKFDLQSKCKFTICFESTKHEGFITEKITDAFMANTIPVYYGSSIAKSIFNPKAFIDCSDYSSLDEVVEKIKELDQNDEKYLEMLCEPILNDAQYYDKFIVDLEKFIKNIFDQDLNVAYRRSRVHAAKQMEKYILESKDPRNACAKLGGKDLLGILFARLKRRVFKKKKE